MSYPPGIRFVPTDEELIIEYLKKKINNQPLPIQDIRVLNLYEFTPDFLAGNYPPLGEKEWYFFTPRNRKYPKGSRPSRSISIGNKVEGYWKASGADKEIKSGEIVIGYKKSLVFYKGKHQHGQKTNWIMHEYTSHQPRPTNRRDASDHMKLDDYVLCRIHIHNKGEGSSSRKKNVNRERSINEAQDEERGQVVAYTAPDNINYGSNMAMVQYGDSSNVPLLTSGDTGILDVASYFADVEANPCDNVQQQIFEEGSCSLTRNIPDNFGFPIDQNNNLDLGQNNSQGIFTLQNGTNLVYPNMVQNHHQDGIFHQHVPYYQNFQEGSSSLTQNPENFDLSIPISNGVSDSTHNDYVANLVYGDSMVQNRQAGSYHQQVSNSSNIIISPFKTRYYESSVEADNSCYYGPDLYDGQRPRKRPHLC